MPHNASHQDGTVRGDQTWKEQDRDREGEWVGEGSGPACNTSSPFPPEPPGAAGSSTPVYYALLATVVLGLLAYVAFKCWRSNQQRRQLAKARAAEPGGLDGAPGPHAPSQGPQPELGGQLYLHLPRQQREEVERLLGGPGDPHKGWQGLAGRLGFQTEAVETLARGRGPACALLRDWAAQGGSGATLSVLGEALAALGREDVVQVLGLPPGGCSVV
ncbi:death domain-containing membrane protein NRADD-like [Pipistrellus kuhlii]|uniref:death domain-containing membrane protein NRADD-like n=1 Tax=Pipistrellus kuhlii TaxID=59472 RepID=UPI001E27455C|nr:death domain-containing membrane protein NRADD-like [Pipistrellus kuhlii]XP_045434741.1 death domain-containing membrane protein NRADD-like [Pipistrellus kuhlii]XP_045434742.1 death domain-containing membrane protein NRADD-like [Pipistrellus kuhlii]XP_045434743.1 death domain-containing membrane protein NRADD-like [Pipistrellus kuhlii]